MKLSNRILKMQYSPIRKLQHYVDSAERRGITLHKLNIGQPDIETPKEFFEAIKRFNEKTLAYSNSQGNSKLIQEFINYYKSLNISFEENEIVITNGGSEAIQYIITTICDNGENILIPEPFYTNYNSFCEMSNVEVIPFLTKVEEAFKLPKKEEITKHINSKTKAIMIANPGNPTGRVYTLEELKILEEIVEEYDLFLIVDEVYREFVYDNIEFISCMKLQKIHNRIILIDSISKRYSACGARIGLVASKNLDVMNNILKLCQARLCSPTLEQISAIALLKTPKCYLEKVHDEYEERRNILYNGLKSIPNLTLYRPQGAFYIIVRLPIKDADDFAIWLLESFSYNNESIVVAPAAGFYATEGLGRNEIRISYCVNKETLKKATKILMLALNEYLETH
ncbi:aspartate aminotransferase [Clostridium cavendishii DSM 21758]|uniref:Aspartate aminotransferase n=1 Tax=Clostridium cavendishii DSM 21758 TaxID=1121302 RepID=A0A1M6FK08_9CLOT|nr:pyridoxal phosphate-dependent aminotransferase [Clostridium cavendishii]SHI97959.1 aspartate aminotransferase [Clostridium cavendishii DSM 21758]